jgi:hypothetical protein
MVRKILTEHHPSPLDEAVEKELVSVIGEAEKREGV